MRSPSRDEEELSQLERELFRSMAADDPPAKARRMVAKGLGLGAFGIAKAAAAAQLTGSPLRLAATARHWLLVAGVGAGLGAAGAGGYHFASRPASTVAVASTTMVSPTAASPAYAVSPTPASPAYQHETAPLGAEPSRTAVLPMAPPSESMAVPKSSPEGTSSHPHQKDGALKTSERSAPRARTQHAEPVSDPSLPANAEPGLAAELAVLDQVHAAVSAKHGSRALTLLDGYSRDFPTGTLRLEAAALRIEALFAQGSIDAGVRLAKDFLATHPTSTHSSRIRHLLSQHDNAASPTTKP